MILLIGGSSHVGKTLAAQKLMERLKIPYLSLDHLKMGMIRTGMTNLTVEDDLEMREFLWPFAAEMIKTAIENQQSMIVEGCYIPGHWRDSFSPEYLSEIRCVFLVMREDYIRSHAAEITDYANAIEQRMDDKVDIGRLILCSKNFKKDCEDYGIPCLEIGGEYDIDRITDRILALAMAFENNYKKG